MGLELSSTDPCITAHFKSAAIDRLERVGFMLRPALLKTRSLAAELAGVVNNADSWLQVK